MIEADFKVTAWERVIIEDESVFDEIVQKIESGVIENSGDLFDYCENNNIKVWFKGVLPETEEQMTIQENDNQSTIEIASTVNVKWWDNKGDENEV